VRTLPGAPSARVQDAALAGEKRASCRRGAHAVAAPCGSLYGRECQGAYPADAESPGVAAGPAIHCGLTRYRHGRPQPSVRPSRATRFAGEARAAPAFPDAGTVQCPQRRRRAR